MLIDPRGVFVATSVTITVPVRIVLVALVALPVGNALTLTLSVDVPWPVALVPPPLNESMTLGFGLNDALQEQFCVFVTVTLTLPPSATTCAALELTV
jgi:hypothetical protein